MKSGRNIILILSLAVILPILVFTGIEISTLNEDEEMLEDMYIQQLDAIIFSINQYSEDLMGSYAFEIENERKRSEGSQLISNNLKQTNVALVGVVERRDLLRLELFDNDLASSSWIPTIDSIFSANEQTIKRLHQYRKSNYQKLETLGEIVFSDRLKFHVILTVFEGGQPCLIIFDPIRLIENVLAPRIQQIARQNLVISVEDVLSSSRIYATDTTRYPVLQSSDLWLLANYRIGIAKKGETIEDLVANRISKNMIALFLMVVFVSLGIILIYRTVRKEMQLSKTKSDFVANVSHEIRTPLSLILMFNETLLLGRVKNESKKKEYYEIIDKEANRLSTIVNKILNFSQIEAEKRNYVLEPLNPGDSIKYVFNTYTYHLSDKGFESNLELNNPDVVIRADTEAFGEALINLIDNAIKYSTNQKKLVVRGFEADGYYVIEVEDKGKGISKKDMPLVFDKFYRVKTGDTYDSRGTGLGLALVSNIMEMHGGRVEVESRVDKGSIFRLFYPIYKSDE